MAKYDLAVVIGRFQPFHNGHLKVIEKAFEVSDEVLILVGSSNGPRTIRNPFSFHERSCMIRSAVTAINTNGKKFTVSVPLDDHMYSEDRWVQQVQGRIDEYLTPSGVHPRKICMVGYSKDASSYYLRLFPQFDLVEADLVAPLDASDIRAMFFNTPEWDPSGLPYRNTNDRRSCKNAEENNLKSPICAV